MNGPSERIRRIRRAQNIARRYICISCGAPIGKAPLRCKRCQTVDVETEVEDLKNLDDYRHYHDGPQARPIVSGY